METNHADFHLLQGRRGLFGSVPLKRETRSGTANGFNGGTLNGSDALQGKNGESQSSVAATSVGQDIKKSLKVLNGDGRGRRDGAVCVCLSRKSGSEGRNGITFRPAAESGPTHSMSALFKATKCKYKCLYYSHLFRDMVHLLPLLEMMD